MRHASAEGRHNRPFTPAVTPGIIRPYPAATVSGIVGVELKWVIGCYWLHEALVRLDRGGAIDWPRLTLDLGYFDQALVIPSRRISRSFLISSLVIAIRSTFLVGKALRMTGNR